MLNHTVNLSSVVLWILQQLGDSKMHEDKGQPFQVMWELEGRAQAEGRQRQGGVGKSVMCGWVLQSLLIIKNHSSSKTQSFFMLLVNTSQVNSPCSKESFKKLVFKVIQPIRLTAAFKAVCGASICSLPLENMSAKVWMLISEQGGSKVTCSAGLIVIFCTISAHSWQLGK